MRSVAQLDSAGFLAALRTPEAFPTLDSGFGCYGFVRGSEMPELPHYRAEMNQMRNCRVRVCVLLLAAASVFIGCGGTGVHFAGGQTSSVPVTMSITDTPPAGERTFVPGDVR